MFSSGLLKAIDNDVDFCLVISKFLNHRISIKYEDTCS